MGSLPPAPGCGQGPGVVEPQPAVPGPHVLNEEILMVELELEWGGIRTDVQALCLVEWGTFMVELEGGIRINKNFPYGGIIMDVVGWLLMWWIIFHCGRIRYTVVE